VRNSSSSKNACHAELLAQVLVQVHRNLRLVTGFGSVNTWRAWIAFFTVVTLAAGDQWPD
jgi:hypothetical protein